MAAQDYTAVVEQLYVSYFGRPADYYGLQNFSAQLAALDTKGQYTTFAAVNSAVQADKAGTSALSKLVNSFGGSAESATLYGNDNSQIGVAKFVNAIYQNVLNRDADVTGLNFWVNAITSGTLTRANAAASITAAALTNNATDAATVTNKLAIATSFTAAIDTVPEITAYSGDAAAAAARALLAGVSSTTDVTAYQANVTAALANMTAVTGSTFALTAGLDNIVGTAGNDVINAYNFNATTGAATTTLSSFDVIDGGAGKDTLNLDLTGGNNTVTGTIRNVEIINITGATAAVDASVFQGATNVNLAGGTAVEIDNLAAGSVAGFSGSTVTGMTVKAAGASASIAMNGTPEGAGITVSGATLSSVTISGTRADTDASGSLSTQAVGITAGKDVQSVSLNTNQATSVTLAENGSSAKHITAFDASASTGKITVSGNSTLASIMTGSGNDTVTLTAATSAAVSGGAAAVNASVSTGAGDDSITVNNAAGSTGLTSVDAGAGNDTITITKLTGAGLNIQGGDGNDTVVISSGTLETTDVINGGAGTDTISFTLTGAHTATTGDYIVLNKLVTGFETIKFTGAAETIDASQLSSAFTTIDLSTGGVANGVGTQALVAHGDLTAVASAYDNSDMSAIVYGGTLNVSDNANGNVSASADVLNLTVKAVAGSTGSATAVVLGGDVQTANITLTSAANKSASPTTDFAASVTVNTGTADAALKSLTLTGNGSADVTNAAGSKLTTVDASGLNSVSAVTGNAAAGLTYHSTNAAAETIKLGSGIDNITLGASTYGKMDTVQGLNLALNSAGTALAATADHLSVTAVATSVVKFTTTQTDLDLALTDAAASGHADVVFTMGGDTYIFHDTGASGVAGQVDATDTIVKLTGITDVKAVIIALGGTPT